MNIQNLFFFATIPCVATVFSACQYKNDIEQKKESNDEKPNIIFIIADDLGVPQVGCYGSSFYRTKHIDKLSEEGVRYTNAYAAGAVCSPTRASIMTGKYPARLHITDFIKGNNGSYPLSEPEWQKFLPLEEYSIAEAIQKIGYKTAMYGKWHLSAEKTPPESERHNPDKQGFEEVLITYKPAKYLPLGEWQTRSKDAHNVDTITSRGIDFIQRNKDKPFFLMLAHNSIHDPLMEDSLLVLKYKNLPESVEEENNPFIAAMIETLDNSIGRVISTLKALGLERNTMVVFYSDNGGLARDVSQAPFREGKAWLYEGGIRVPLIIWWPERIEQGSICNQMVSSIDFMPTLLNIAGYQNLDTLKMDGINILPSLKGESLSRNELYWNRPHYHSVGSKPACAVRMGDYKLIEWYEPKLIGDGDCYELFNLKEDISEQHNLVNELPEIKEELIRKLSAWKSDVRAQEPTINKTFGKQ